MKKYLFIDRDGTLVNEPYDYQVDKLEKISLKKDVISALLKLKDNGYSFVMVSNQDGLGTQSFPLEDFTLCHEFILNIFSSQGIEFEQVLICPHFEQDNCTCRKPKIGLVLPYLQDTTWDRSKSYVIGDRNTDKLLADNMGLKSFILTDTCTWNNIVHDILNQDRTATIERNTKETQIKVSVNLDNNNFKHIDTGIGFFDHMLDQIATHAQIGMDITVKGDLQVDSHHTIEDTALALGSAIKTALGDKRGIARFGFVLPMDELHAKVFALNTIDDKDIEVCLDISGRPYANLHFNANFTRDNINGFETQMVSHFFQSLAFAMGLTLYMQVDEGNCHHQVEALFKAFARALGQAIKVNGNSLPSSKGAL